MNNETIRWVMLVVLLVASGLASFLEWGSAITRHHVLFRKVTLGKPSMIVRILLAIALAMGWIGWIATFVV